jgi:hypothetical protein
VKNTSVNRFRKGVLLDGLALTSCTHLNGHAGIITGFEKEKKLFLLKMILLCRERERGGRERGEEGSERGRGGGREGGRERERERESEREGGREREREGGREGERERG